MSDFLVSIGSRLKSLRREKGLTQEELAEKADLQYSYIGGIERGERNISLITFQKVLEALEVSPLGFFSFHKDKIVEKEQHKAQSLLKINQLLNTLSAEEIVVINKIIYNMLEFKSKENEPF